jgi:exodeoxyribonuclease VII small subunit
MARASFGGVEHKAASRDPATAGEPTFEEILGRLSEVVEKLEGGDLPLETSLAIFEEGIRLSRLGGLRLDEAEARVEKLLSDEGGVTTRPLEGAETE